MKSNPSLASADEEPRQHRKKKRAPPVRNRRHIGSMQDVMALYATIEMFQGEIRQYRKHD
jgi:hypothetical protein